MVLLVVDPTDPRLKRGDKHAAVGTVQRALNRSGATPALDEDGDFGGRTEAATLRFQAASPRVRGVIGGVVCFTTLEALYVLPVVSEQLKAAPLPQHIDNRDWASKIRHRRINLGSMTVNPNTRMVEPCTGNGFLLEGFEHLVGGRMEYNKAGEFWVFHNREDLDRASAAKNECALLVQSFGVDKTRNWRRGPQVRALLALTRGTVIATLRDGVYYSDHSGRSHVGIFDSFIIGKDGKRTGFRMYDQSNGADIKLSTYQFYDKYNRDDMRSSNSRYGDFTIPVYDDNQKLLGFAVIDDPYYKNHKYKWVGIGDEYYVVYSNSLPNLVMIPD